MTTKERKKVISYILLIVVVSVVLSVWGSRMDTSGIISFVQKMGAWGPLIFIVILIIPSVIAPLSGSPIFIAGYVLFGTKTVFYSYLAALIAAARHLIGIRGFGIFLPAALSVSFVATGPIVGIIIFLLIVFSILTAKP